MLIDLLEYIIDDGCLVELGAINDSGSMCVTVQTAFDLAANLFCTLHIRRFTMNLNIAAEPLLALVIGILILLVPRFLNYFVAVYLIVVGILGLMHHSLT